MSLSVTQVQGFVDRVANVYHSADTSDGFHASSIRDLGTWLHSWGRVELPAYFPTPPSKKQIAMTLSLWQDLESVAAFSSYGPHGEALTKRREWFEKSKFPESVAWWIPEDHFINWKEVTSDWSIFTSTDPLPSVLTFTQPFDPNGNATKLDRETVNAKAAKNARRDG